MKAFLMHRRPRLRLERGAARPTTEALTQDLELDVLFGAMAGGDAFLLDVAPGRRPARA